MTRPVTLSYTLVDPSDTDCIAAAQQLVGAGNLTIDGVLASSGSVSFTGGGYQLAIASTGNLSAITFTVTGTDGEGRSISEAIAGPNNNTVETSKYFKTVTQIAADGAVGTNVIVGIADEFASTYYIVSSTRAVSSIGVGISSGATVNYKIQHMVMDPQSTANASQVWYDHSTLANQSASAASSYIAPVRAVRLVMNSYTSTPTMTVTILQAWNS